MNTKSLLYLSCLLAATLATSTVNAGPHRRGNNNFNSTRSRSGAVRNFVRSNRIASWNAQRWSGRNFVGTRHWNGAYANNWYWHHHHRHFRDFVFVDFGFPFWGWGSPYYYDYYPYGGYPSAYPYGYNGGAYYENDYHGNNSNYDYGNGYNNSYGYNNNGSNVTELQRKLADAGYYRGPIDGIMGSRTYYALKAYRHDHANGKNKNGGYSPTLRDKPYSPPPVTTEPTE